MRIFVQCETATANWLLGF